MLPYDISHSLKNATLKTAPNIQIYKKRAQKPADIAIYACAFNQHRLGLRVAFIPATYIYETARMSASYFQNKGNRHLTCHEFSYCTLGFSHFKGFYDSVSCKSVSYKNCTRVSYELAPYKTLRTCSVYRCCLQGIAHVLITSAFYHFLTQNLVQKSES